MDGYRAYGRTTADFIGALAEVPGTNGFQALQPAAEPVSLYPADSGGSPITGLLDETGTPITGVTPTAPGFLPLFYVPDAVAEVWAPLIDGTRVRLMSFEQIDGIQGFAEDAAASASAAISAAALVLGGGVGIDLDGVPFFGAGVAGAVITADTDGVPYFTGA